MLDVEHSILNQDTGFWDRVGGYCPSDVALRRGFGTQSGRFGPTFLCKTNPIVGDIGLERAILEEKQSQTKPNKANFSGGFGLFMVWREAWLWGPAVVHSWLVVLDYEG